MVALQALALYSTLVFSPKGSSTVTVQSPSSQLTFDVNQNNKLLYQEELLKDVTGKHSLEVKGTACASVQVSSHCISSCFYIILILSGLGFSDRKRRTFNRRRLGKEGWLRKLQLKILPS